MKKLFYIFPLLLCGMLVGCDKEEEYVGPIVDPPGISLFVWENNSMHDIKMTVHGRFSDKSILPGEYFMQDWSAFVIPPSVGEYVKEGISIRFDDGTYGGDFLVSSGRKLDPGEAENYEREYWKGDNNVNYARWTYSFTDADYEAAVARGPMENWQDDAHWGFE